MKQHITKEQWDELGREHKIVWLNFIGNREAINEFCADHNSFTEYPTIGEMIEFLGSDLTFIRNNIHTWEVYTGTEAGHFKKAGELADALWEAVKDKLNAKG